ncbi:MAG TPA: peptide-methionine (S)-S-oxide reductase MsrA [Steroidobacteraceae bacterium]|jgi:peptide-methionine (S)-S-oxide reductase|nr:peptide-methionine (S)-S-oxide reductase MsrA [Steroidobacteraceae bacterium]
MTSWKRQAAAAISACAVMLILWGAIGHLAASAAERPVAVPPPAVDNPKAAGPMQTAVLAGGCFWGVQAVFQHLNGVQQAISGYAGGDRSTAQYEIVSSGQTGHAESVKVTFDPNVVSYGQILQVFFSVVHDPTQLNRQGPDSGTQYRSAIFYADDQQQEIATAYIAQLDKAGMFGKPIVTRVDKLKGFYAAEGYHQDYLLKHPNQPYIVFNDQPKVRNFERTLPALWRAEAVRVGSGGE